ncbi:MAG: ATP-binding cassette domain-containing protein [Elusimicrobia bacterium]|nr:ATP-binding cassette domain-containing protein [Elusimicrobiota bacterium]
MRRLPGIRAALAAAAALSLLEVGVDGALTLSYKLLLDDVFPRHDARLLAAVLGGLAAGAALAAVLSVWSDRAWARWAARASAALRQEVLDEALRLRAGGPAAVPAGDILSRFSTDLGAFDAWLTGAVNGLVLPALNVAMGAALLFVLMDWRLAAPAAALWPLVLIGPRLIAPRAAAAVAETKRREAALLAALEEPVSALRSVKAYGLERAARDRFDRALRPFQRSLERGAFLSAMVERSTVLTIYAVQIALVAATAVMTFRGRLSPGSFVAFAGVFWNLGWSVVVATRSAPVLLSARESLRRVDGLLARVRTSAERRRGRAVAPLRRSIRLEDVAFSYPGGGKVLSGLTLEIPRGSYAALVGSSGSGKSTVLSLLAGFQAPTSGRVLFDGADAAEADLASLRAQMGFVFQDEAIFRGTLRENIRLGRPGASDADVERAARAAALHETARALPGGYDAALGPDALSLSGGQRQRLGLARALVREPAVLLLDEATSALDPATEAAVNETLKRGAAGRTTVAVTHRLAAAADADVIFVLSDGRVAESGAHADLLARGGLYADLWRRQDGFALSADGACARVTPARLREIPLLSPLSDAQRSALAEKFASVRAPAGHDVVREGEPGELFYLIVRGQVAVLRAGPRGPVEVATLGAGEEFGEQALLGDAPRSATVRAKTDCLFLTLSRGPFFDLLNEAPEVRRRVLAAAESRRGADAA